MTLIATFLHISWPGGWKFGWNWRNNNNEIM